MGLRDKLLGKSDENVDNQNLRELHSYKYAVHISYSTKDTEIANQICYVLEQNNLKCWIAPRDIASGEPYAQQIVEGITDSSIQVLVFSRYSNESKFVLNEVQLAFNQNKPIIAFKIDESLPEGDMEYFLKATKWIEAYPSPQDKYEYLVTGALNLFENRNDYAVITKPKNETFAVKNNTNPNTPDVYISYSENDRGVIGEVCDSLEDRNISCWLRDREDYNSVVSDRLRIIEESKALILILSRNSNNSNIVNTEVDMAFSYGIPIICFKIDESKLEGTLAFYLTSKQCIDASSDFNNGLNGLIEHVLKTVPPTLPDSHITFSSASDKVRIGGVIALSGSLNGESGEISGAYIDIHQNGELIDTVISSRNGRFSAVIPVTSTESYEFKAVFRGNDEYNGCKSELVVVDVVEGSIHEKTHKDNIQGDDGDVGEEGFINLTDEDIDAGNESIPHVDRVPFPAYDGDDAYAFVSYSHRDYEVVYEEIERFHNQGLNIWYDEGIAPGNEWLAEIGEALNDASLFIVFISNNAVGSKFVRKEITFAINNDIPFIAIHIEKTKMPIQLDLALGDLQAILKYGMNKKEYYRRYTKAFNRIMKDYGIRLKRVESLAKSSAKKDVVNVSSDVVKSEDDILEYTSKEAVENDVLNDPLPENVGDEFNFDEPDEVKYNFSYLDKLIHSGEKEIVLDEDIILGNGEDSKYKNGIEISNEMVLDGNGHTIDACGKARIFNCCDTVTVKNVTLKNGFSKSSGGAIYNSRNLTILDSTLDNNASNEDGGAIYNSGYLNVIGSTLNNNRAKLGGAIYNPEVTVIAELMGTSSGRHDVKVKIKDSTLNNNAAEDGGAIYTSQNIEHNPNPDRYDMLDAQKQHGVELDNCEMKDNETTDFYVKRRYTRRS